MNTHADTTLAIGIQRPAAERGDPVQLASTNGAGKWTKFTGNERIRRHLPGFRVRAMAALGMCMLCVGLLAALLSTAAGQESAKPVEAAEVKEFSTWMEVKVDESQKVFAGLAMADFKAIEDSAAKLKTLNALEEFVRRTTPGYQTQLRSFEFAVDEIRRQAKQENIEGVVMGFHQLTLSCVNCHKQIRRPATGEASLPDDRR